MHEVAINLRFKTFKNQQQQNLEFVKKKNDASTYYVT